MEELKDDSSVANDLMQVDSKYDDHLAESKIGGGSLDPQEYSRLKSFENRKHLHDLTREEIKTIAFSQDLKHPLQRSMIKVDSNTFN